MISNKACRYLLAAAAVLVLLSTTVRSSSAADMSARTATIDGSVRYLQQVQNGDGGFGVSPGKQSSPGFTSWAALALAAAGINPRDQRMPGSGNQSAFDYLSTHLDNLVEPTDFARTLLVLSAAGVDEYQIGGYDLVARLLQRQQADGSFIQLGGAGINATAFAVLALCRRTDDPTRLRREQAVTWLAGQQNEDGGFGITPASESNSDITAAVIEAIRCVRPTNDITVTRALDFLAQVQNDDGGFPATADNESNASSTSWVLQALWAAGMQPSNWHKSAGDPLTFLASLQQSDGHIRQSASSDASPIWVTAFAVPALSGRPLPITPVARVDKQTPASPPTEQSSIPAFPTARQASPSDQRQIGTSSKHQQQDRGVLYGGGGQGARLFSRPQPAGTQTLRPDQLLRRSGRDRKLHRPQRARPASTGAPLKHWDRRGGGVLNPTRLGFKSRTTPAGFRRSGVPRTPGPTDATRAVSGFPIGIKKDKAEAVAGLYSSPTGSAATLLGSILGTFTLAGAIFELKRRP